MKQTFQSLPEMASRLDWRDGGGAAMQVRICWSFPTGAVQFWTGGIVTGGVHVGRCAPAAPVFLDHRRDPAGLMPRLN